MRIVYLLFGIAWIAGCSNSSPRPLAGPSSSVTDASTEPPAPAGEYPATATWEHANQRQRQRAERSFAQLKKHNVPVYGGPLFVDDDEEVKIHNAQAVARRALVLWAVTRKAGGIPQEEALLPIQKLGLWDSVSEDEKRYLKDASPDPAESEELVWRLECLWVLMWSLGYIDDLDWPSGMCDVPKLVEIIKPHETNPAFIAEAKLRSTAELLDAQDLTMRIHWAIRDAQLNQRSIPEDLNWAKPEVRVTPRQSAAAGVVAERHYVLNWLVNFLSPKSWDDVDTPT